MIRPLSTVMGALCAIWYAGLAAAGPSASAPPSAPNSAHSNDLYQMLASKRFVDLTHTFGPKTPHWKGFGEEVVTTLYTIKKDGFKVQRFTHVGQWGTRVDAPAHFHEGLLTADRIDPKDMLLPLVVIDVHEKAAESRLRAHRR